MTEPDGWDLWLALSSAHANRSLQTTLVREHRPLVSGPLLLDVACEKNVMVFGGVRMKARVQLTEKIKADFETGT